MPVEKQEELSYEDDLAADAMAAFKEVSARNVEVEPAKAVEPAPEPTKEAEPARAPESDGRERDEHGRFKAKEEPAKAPEKAASELQKATSPAQDAAAAPQAPVAAAPAAGPPTSWSIKAKAAWDQLPEAIRSEIAKRESEVSRGFGALRDYKDLKPFAERAQREGTTLAKAVDHYVRMDDALRQDLGRGIATIAQNAGLSQQQAAELFSKLAQQYGGTKPTQSPSNGAATANGADDPLHSLLRPMLDPLMTEMQGLRKEFTSRVEADRNAQTMAQVQADQKIVDAFKSKPEHRYFEDVRQDIIALFNSGRVKETGDLAADLKTAYEMASWQHPEIREALIEQRLTATEAAKRQKEQEAVEKAKAASRSLTGNRLPGTTVKEVDAPENHDDVEADVRKAMRSLQSA